MKEEETVAARLSEPLVSDIEKIEIVEQADRSTILRNLLHKAVTERKKRIRYKTEPTLGQSRLEPKCV